MGSLRSLIVLLLVQLAFITYINSQVSRRFFRKDYTYLLSVDNFYKIHTIHRTWGEAKNRCALEGAELFYPQDGQEAEAVTCFSAETQPFHRMFVGISRNIAKDVFKTIAGQPLDDVYNNWATGEPNEQDLQEVCVTLGRDGKLNDDRCDRKYPYICKKSFADLEWNYDCDMPNRDYMFNKTLRKCYKFHLTPKDWSDASVTCHAEQSYLAIIQSQAEADHLVQMTADAPKDKVSGNFMSGAVHLGFHKSNTEGWKTVKGVPLQDSGYSLWGGSQPDNSGGQEVCGTMFYNGRLNDINCDRRCFFICEHDIGGLTGSMDDRLNELL